MTGAVAAVPRDAGAAFVDAHAHLHARFDAARQLDAAWAHAQREAAALGVRAAASVLMLAQTAGNDRFERLAAGGQVGAWAVAPAAEPESLVARREDGGCVLLVCGRQVATREGLEVLALATRATFPDGVTADEALTAARAAGALPVLPWGVGKWLGRRGEIVRGLVERHAPHVLCGDNANRPWFWPRPALFAGAEASGVRVLPGTDPLPLPSEEGRAGSFGFVVREGIPVERPAAALRRMLADQGTRFEHYGRLESAGRFLRNQLLLRLRPTR